MQTIQERLRDGSDGWTGDAACVAASVAEEAADLIDIFMAEGLLISDYEEAFQSHREVVRLIDVIINGEAGAAKQASLCDLVGQIEQLVAQRNALAGYVSIFLGGDDRFQVAVGGNPLVVDSMLASARAALTKAGTT